MDQDKVKDKLELLDKFKTLGLDNMHPKVLKELANELCIPLTILFNQSVGTGVVPHSWKQAIVTPIYKSLSKTQANNCRQVSLTSITGKVLGSIIRVILLKALKRETYFAKINMVSDKESHIQQIYWKH